MSSNDAAQIVPHTDPYGYLGFIKNPDGSITRGPNSLPSSPPSSDPDLPVLAKDVPINQQTNTWARLYLPRPKSDVVPAKKLPLIVYYHGGALVLCSVATSTFQKFLSDIALELPAMIVSAGYRLAPEHRLPAAYDDSMEALHWIQTTDDEWLTKYVDFSKCFLMGTSAGGNIAYHVGLRAATGIDELIPLQIRGLVLHTPFFGGVQRTKSELRLSKDQAFPPVAADLSWELALPIGADRDHEYCNPTAGMKRDVLEKVRDLGWKFLVTGCEGDPLVDRQIELVKMLEKKGVDVTGEFSDGGYHGWELTDESAAKIFYGVLKSFVSSC